MSILTIKVKQVNGEIVDFGTNPSEMEWSLQDISSPDSGRDLAGTMWKERLDGEGGQKRKLTCKWNASTWKEASDLLKAVQAQYFEVTYPDILDFEYQTRTFYIGDRRCPVYMWTEDKLDSQGLITEYGKKYISSISFDFIER